MASYLLPVCDILKSPEEEDALPLRLGDRLHYPRLSWVLLKLLHEYVVLRLKQNKTKWYITTRSTKTCSTNSGRTSAFLLTTGKSPHSSGPFTPSESEIFLWCLSFFFWCLSLSLGVNETLRLETLWHLQIMLIRFIIFPRIKNWQWEKIFNTFIARVEK